MRDQIIAALWAELGRQSNAAGADAPWVARGAEYAFPPHFAKIDGAVDLDAIVGAVLATLREPTPSMLSDDAVWAEALAENAAGVWRAMIAVLEREHA